MLLTIVNIILGIKTMTQMMLKCSLDCKDHSMLVLTYIYLNSLHCISYVKPSFIRGFFFFNTKHHYENLLISMYEKG